MMTNKEFDNFVDMVRAMSESERARLGCDIFAAHVEAGERGDKITFDSTRDMLQAVENAIALHNVQMMHTDQVVGQERGNGRIAEVHKVDRILGGEGWVAASWRERSGRMVDWFVFTGNQKTAELIADKMTR